MNNSSSYWTLTDGTGLGATGYQSDAAKTGIGIYGKGVHGSNQPAAGGYFEGGSSYVCIGFRNSSGTNFKANGNGTVSTIVKNENNELVNLFCPEAPEGLFFDFGESQLQNGRAYVKLDPIFAKNIYVDEQHPLRVFIQVYEDEDCQGVVVKKRTKDGFKVVERNKGKSNAKFTW